MYVQPPQRGIPTDGEGFSIPTGYSGNAFREAMPPPAEEIAAPPSPPPEEEKATPLEAAPVLAAPQPPPREAVPTGRVSLLSSLLPPARGEGKGSSHGLSDLVIPALLLWMLWDSKENDVLPFLVALLLWD
jgi:hypothetical protein